MATHSLNYKVAELFRLGQMRPDSEHTAADIANYFACACEELSCMLGYSQGALADRAVVEAQVRIRYLPGDGTDWSVAGLILTDQWYLKRWSPNGHLITAQEIFAEEQKGVDA